MNTYVQFNAPQAKLLYSFDPQERVCEDSASFDLTSHDLAQCIGDIGHILDLKKKGETYLEEGGTYISTVYNYEGSMEISHYMFLTVHIVLYFRVECSR